MDSLSLSAPARSLTSIAFERLRVATLAGELLPQERLPRHPEPPAPLCAGHVFRSSIPGLPFPLSTLRPRPQECARMTRGRRSWLILCGCADAAFRATGCAARSRRRRGRHRAVGHARHDRTQCQSASALRPGGRGARRLLGDLHGNGAVVHRTRRRTSAVPRARHRDGRGRCAGRVGLPAGRRGERGVARVPRDGAAAATGCVVRRPRCGCDGTRAGDGLQLRRAHGRRPGVRRRGGDVDPRGDRVHQHVPEPRGCAAGTPRELGDGSCERGRSCKAGWRW